MGAAISLLVILSLSVFVVRVAAVILRLTGLPESVARFQALSAFSGSGFTTAESEAVVNYPIRRRVIGLLMVFGNLGLVTVLATVSVSFLNNYDSMEGMTQQLLWLFAAIAILWLIALNPVADRIMCGSIHWLLKGLTSLDKRGPTKLLQATSGYSVAEHRIPHGDAEARASLSEFRLAERDLMVLGIKRSDGSYRSAPEPNTRIAGADRLVLYGPEQQHVALHEEIHGG